MNKVLDYVYKNKYRIIFALLLLATALTVLIAYTYSSFKPKDIVLSNKTDRSVTISWYTEEPTIGQVIVREGDRTNPIILFSKEEGRFYDDRDVSIAEIEHYQNNQGFTSEESFKVENQGKYFLHHVTVSNLAPETEYTFYTGNGTVFRKVSTEFNNGEVFKTYSMNNDISVPDPAYGLVRLVDFEKTALTDGVLYMKIVDDADGTESNLLSSLMNDQGAWYIDLSNARVSDGDDFYFSVVSVDTETVQENLTVHAGPHGIHNSKISIHVDAPAATIFVDKKLEVIDASMQINLVSGVYAESWTVTCSDGRTFSESDPGTQAGFNAVWGDGRSNWEQAACAQTTCAPPGCGNTPVNVGGGSGSTTPQEPSTTNSACTFNGDAYSSNVSCCGQGNADNPKPIGSECSGSGAFCANGGGCDGFGPLACSRCPDGAYRCTLGGEGCEGAVAPAVTAGSSTPGSTVSGPICCVMKQNEKYDYKKSDASVGCKSGYSQVDLLKCSGTGTTIGTSTKPYNTELEQDEFCKVGDVCLCKPTGAVLNPSSTDLKCGKFLPAAVPTAPASPAAPVTPTALKVCVNNVCQIDDVCSSSNSCKCGPNAWVNPGGTCTLALYQTPPPAVLGTAMNTPDTPPNSTDQSIVAEYCGGGSYGQAGTKGWCYCCANNPSSSAACAAQGAAQMCDPATGNAAPNIHLLSCAGTPAGTTQNLNGQDYMCRNQLWNCFQDNLTEETACTCDTCICGSATRRGEEGSWEATKGQSCGVGTKYYASLNPLADDCKNPHAQEGYSCLTDPSDSTSLSTCAYYCVPNPNGSGGYGGDPCLRGPDVPAPELACKKPNELWIKVSNEEADSSTKQKIAQNKLISTVNAAGLETYQLDVKEGALFVESGGSYIAEIDGKPYQFDVLNNEVETVLYFDNNANGTYDDGDETIELNLTSLVVAQEYSYYTSSLKQGINLVSFDVIDFEEGNTAAKLLTQLDKENPGAFYSISKYSSGKWDVVGFRDGQIYGGVDFQILPGNGYLIRTTRDVDIKLKGKKIEETVPLYLTPGWNLIGLNALETSYTAESFLTSFDNNPLGLKVDNLTKWDVSKGRYEGLQREIGEEDVYNVYGLDFPIYINNGYFVRVLEGEGKWTP